MRNWLGRRWKLLSVIGVVALVLGLCTVRYWPSDDGPMYTRAGDGPCAGLPFEVFEPALGALSSDPRTGSVDGAPACQVAYRRPYSLTVSVHLLDSPSEAENAYYSSRSALSEHDAWELDLPVKKAQWSLGEFQARAAALDGNMLIIVTIAGVSSLGQIDVHFGEPMTAFLRAAVAKVRQANQVSV